MDLVPIIILYCLLLCIMLSNLLNCYPEKAWWALSIGKSSDLLLGENWNDLAQSWENLVDLLAFLEYLSQRACLLTFRCQPNSTRCNIDIPIRLPGLNDFRGSWHWVWLRSYRGFYTVMARKYCSPRGSRCYNIMLPTILCKRSHSSRANFGPL